MSIPVLGGTVAQTVQMIRRAMPRKHTLLVVEGRTDKKAFAHILADDVRVYPANGKSNLLRAYDALSTSPDGIFFIMDCDNNSEPDRKGLPNLAITTNRDLEADMLFALNAFERVAIEHLSESFTSIGAVRTEASAALDRATRLAVSFGLTRDTARSLGLATRFHDPVLRKRRVLRPADLATDFDALPHWPTTEEVVRLMGPKIGWSTAETRRVWAAVSAPTPCAHTTHTNEQCQRIHHCNGHDAVQALAQSLQVASGIPVNTDDVEKSMRLAVDRSRLEGWSVANRVRAWEQRSGFAVLAG